MKLIIFTDGACRGNPGKGAIGYLIIKDTGDLINIEDNKLEGKGSCIGKTTNNEAEYKALIKAVNEALKYNPVEIKCYSDSNLMVNQLNGNWRINSAKLKNYFNIIKNIECNFKKITYHHVRRNNEGIFMCDAYANQALDNC